MGVGLKGMEVWKGGRRVGRYGREGRRVGRYGRKVGG